MQIWILVAALGGLLALAGVVRLHAGWRAGRISGRRFVATVVGLLSLIAFALVGNVTPELASGAVLLALALPGCVAIVVLVREHGRTQANGS